VALRPRQADTVVIVSDSRIAGQSKIARPQLSLGYPHRVQWQSIAQAG